LPDGARHLEWLRDDHAQGLAREIILEGPPVDGDATLARPEPYASDGGLAPAGAIETLGDGHHRAPFCPASVSGSASGCCACCGCTAPRSTFNFLAIARPKRFFGSMP